VLGPGGCGEAMSGPRGLHRRLEEAALSLQESRASAAPGRRRPLGGLGRGSGEAGVVAAAPGAELGPAPAWAWSPSLELPALGVCGRAGWGGRGEAECGLRTEGHGFEASPDPLARRVTASLKRGRRRSPARMVVVGMERWMV
jgi:hypothetical protein